MPGSPQFAAPAFAYAGPTTTVIHHVEYVSEHKSPGVAALLSFLLCGAGQIYNGEVGKGLLFFFLCWTIILAPIMWIWSICDAYSVAERSARRRGRRRR